MKYPRDDLVGRTFGRLRVKNFYGYPDSSPSKAQWGCVCDCGNECLVYGYNLKNGNTNSCGCFKIDRTKAVNSTHRMTKTSSYATYSGMLARCYNKGSKGYSSYGGRGIYVCDRWLGDGGFENFLSDMGLKPSPKHSLDRKDNDGPYSPQNCRWATQTEQCRNRRDNVIVDFRGESILLRELCEKYNVPYNRVRWRLAEGWPIERAIFTRRLR